MLGAALRSRDNSLNAVRLALATAVIAGHAWILGGFGASRIEGLTGMAVNGFFALSGFLIAGSRWRSSMRDFLIRRVARIFPGFLVCLVVVAAALAPLSAMLGPGQLQPGSAAAYVARNLGLVVTQHGIADTLASVPYPRVWNGSLWTLSYEFAAYIVCGLALGLALVRRHAALVCSAAVAVCLLGVLVVTGPLQVYNVFRLGACFATGMALFVARDRVPLTVPLAAASALVTTVAFLTLEEPWLYAVTTVPFAYALLWLGARVPIRLGQVNDISYGIYIYAFPVQQLLAVAGVQRAGVLVFTMASIAATIPAALASWHFVERPALRWARRLTRRAEPVGTAATSPTTSPAG
ncbi:MAG TPA: acyltransferase [Dermatophilaceae bacterium]|nr:acyltransferase [Dermatophilaceae bacterium]